MEQQLHTTLVVSLTIFNFNAFALVLSLLLLLNKFPTIVHLEMSNVYVWRTKRNNASILL